jgi:hypothetical protein
MSRSVFPSDPCRTVIHIALEVVDDQAEDDVSNVVSEEARGVRILPVAVAGEVLDEADLR